MPSTYLHLGVYPFYRDVETDNLLQNFGIVDRADGRRLACHLTGHEIPAQLLVQKCQQRRRVKDDQK